MDILYRELFSIRCKHEYYGSDDCKVLTLRPTPECERMLSRYRCRFRPAAGGGSVWCGAPQLLRSFKKHQTFQFTLVNSDPAFSLYTDLGKVFAPPDQTLYWYSNFQNESAGQDANTISLLHLPDVTTNTMPVKQAVFRHQFEGSKTGAVFAVVHATDPEVKLKVNAPSGSFKNCTLDLSPLPEGRYRLLLDDKEELHFILSAQNPAAQWGGIEIFARGIGDGSATPKAFQIKFVSQSTTWRYFIIDQPRKGQSEASKFKNHKVVGRPGPQRDPRSDTLPDFIGPIETELAGKEASMFESSGPIELYAQPGGQHSFHLLTEEQAGDVDAEGIKLSYATAPSTRANREANGVRLVSDIVHYL